MHFVNCIYTCIHSQLHIIHTCIHRPTYLHIILACIRFN